MDKQILQYAVTASADEWSMMSLETAALVLAAKEAHGGPAALDAKAAAWARARQPLPASDTARRMQPILDALLEEIGACGCDRLAGDEAAFLLAVLHLAALLPADHPDRRAESTLLPLRNAIAERARGGPNRNGIAMRITLVTARHLAECPQREIAKFAGIDVAFRGPVYAAAGSVKIIGGVPEQCLVAVESGACLIEGYLMGRVAARHDCIVQENIAGTAVVREGDVRARNLVDRSVVVSKQGSVYCMKALQPDLVFAGAAIVVREEAVMARMIGRRIEIAGSALGGFLQVAEYAKASHFRQTDARPLRIALRERLSCEDYGESLPPHVRRMIAKTNRLEREIAANRQRSATLDGEAEEAARTALLYLTGREQVNQRVEELGRLQRRLSALNRTILGVDMLARAAEESLDDADLDHRDSDLDDMDAFMGADDSDSHETTYDAVVEDIRRELRLFIRAGQHREHKPVERGRSRRVLAEVRSKLRDWVAERAELKRALTTMRSSMSDEDRQWTSALGLAEGATLIQALHALLTRIRQQDVGDVLRARAASPFVSIMLRTIAQRKEKARFHAEMAARLESEMARTIAALKKESQAHMYDDRPAEGAWVAGTFDPGIRIVMDPALAYEADPPEELVVCTEVSAAATRYVRRMEGIIEEP